MKVRVIKSTGSWYVCIDENGQQLSARIKGKFRMDGLKTTNPIAVGDFVEIDKEEGLDSWMINEIHKRDNYIIRRSPRNYHKKHIIASNLDQLFVVATLKTPRTSTGFIDRMLMVAEMHHIRATVLFNKKDLYKDKQMNQFALLKETYEKMGYSAVLMSAFDEADIDLLKSLLKDKTTLVAGHSGVGKSSIINQLGLGLELHTQEISTFNDKGMHTTTFAEMFPLPDGGFIVDTPGIKELEAVDIEPEEVGHYFAEMRDLLTDCKFNNCLHQNEPKCAVKMAFEAGEIAEFRYTNYLKVLEDLQAKNYWER